MGVGAWREDDVVVTDVFGVWVLVHVFWDGCGGVVDGLVGGRGFV